MTCILKWLIAHGRGRPVISKLKCSLMSVVIEICAKPSGGKGVWEDVCKEGSG